MRNKHRVRIVTFTFRSKMLRNPTKIELSFWLNFHIKQDDIEKLISAINLEKNCESQNNLDHLMVEDLMNMAGTIDND